MAFTRTLTTSLLLMMVVATLGNQIIVEVATRYITTAETTLHQKESKTFTATLCSRFNNHIINATMLLNNNPSWDPLIGVIDYYIVDSPTKGRKDALCNNTDSSGKRHSTCLISKWTSTSDLFLVATAGEVDSIVFSIDIEIRPLSTLKNNSRMQKPSPDVRSENMQQSLNNRALQDTEILTEIVDIMHTQSLMYHDTALLNVSFCKNSQTTDNYQITSSVFGTDGQSSYAQYLCSGPPCQVDGSTVIGFDGKQLPNNNVFLSTESGQYQNFLVLIVCWAGEYDPRVKNYVGHFQYNAAIKKTEL